jgi:hypothetical protein
LQPERAGGGFYILLGRRVGRIRRQKLVERRENIKKGPITITNFRLSFPTLRVVEKFRIKGKYKDERGGRKR